MEELAMKFQTCSKATLTAMAAVSRTSETMTEMIDGKAYVKRTPPGGKKKMTDSWNNS